MTGHGTEADVDRLLSMGRPALDRLFRAGRAGETPDGEGAGTVLLGKGTAVSEAAAELVRILAWQDKVFDAGRGELRNKVTLFGVRAVRAKVSRSPSLFDGKECIVLDYSSTSLLAHRVRDEIRQIAPGLYLGIAYWGRRKVINFALRFPGPGVAHRTPEGTHDA